MPTVSQNDLLINKTVKAAVFSMLPIQQILRRPYLSPKDGNHKRVKHQPRKKLEPKRPTCQPFQHISLRGSTHLKNMSGLE